MALATIGPSSARAAEPEKPRAGTAPPLAGEVPADARRGADTRRALQEAMRLAEALHEEDALLELYSERARRRDAPRATLESLVAAAEAGGVPERAVAILDRRIRQGADPLTSAELLAQLLTRAGRARDAAGAWAKLAELRGEQGLAGEEALAYARVLSRLDQDDRAWEVLAAAPPPAIDARSYWTARGMLAWQQNRDTDAERSYREAWELGEHTPEARQRLGTLARVHGNVSGLARLARSSYGETKDPSELIEVGQAQLEAGDWKALGETLALAARDEVGRFAELTAYWTLRAQWLAHSGDQVGALDAWKRAFARAPEAALGAEYLWSVLALHQKADLSSAVERLTALGLAETPEVREPLALALVELGRVAEALRLWARELGDPQLLTRDAYGLATALAATGRVEAAARVRRRADRGALAERGQVTKEALQTTEGRERFLGVADALGTARGAEVQVRWMRAVLANTPSSLSPEVRADLWARLRDAEGRTADARALWSRASHDHALEVNARERMLRLALEDDDRPFLRAAVAEPRRYPTDAIVQAALRVGDLTTARDRLAGEPAPATDVDRLAQMNDLRMLEERRASRLSVSGAYESVGPVTAYGPDATASVAWDELRLGLEAGGRELQTPGVTFPISSGTREAEALAVLQASAAPDESLTEVAAGVSYHSAGTLPRGRALHERWLAGGLLLSLRAGLAERVDDAPLLRALATATTGGVTLRFEEGLFYGSLAVQVRDDRTHRFARLGTQLSEEAEGGLRLLRGRPEIAVGVRAYAQQRDNTTTFPADILTSWPDPTFTPAEQLPRSYSFVALALRLAHGDLGERRALAGASWPRYECGVEAGLRFPDREPATGGQCSLGVRVGSQGVLSASALYGWGLVAFARGTGARFTLGYDRRF
ncbi:MAG TPA: tetratricopeptide repeat protein [Polyangia bacterium]